MSVATIEIVSLLATDGPPVSNEKASQGMLFMVSIFTFMLWTLTFKMNKTINSLFFLLGSTCMLLSWGVRNEIVDRVGGWFGVATSVNAFWLACKSVLSIDPRKFVWRGWAYLILCRALFFSENADAELVNDVWGEGKEIIPLGHWNGNPFRNIGALHLPGRTHGPPPGARGTPGTATPLADVEAATILEA